MNKKSPLIFQQVCQGENTFRSRPYLVVYGQTHEEEKTCECSGWGKDFSSKEYLIVHHKAHTGEKLHECSEHGKAFSFSSQQVKAFTEAVIPMNIVNVRMSAEKISSFYTREVINVQDRNPMGVINVGKLLV